MVALKLAVKMLAPQIPVSDKGSAEYEALKLLYHAAYALSDNGYISRPEDYGEEVWFDKQA